MKTEYKTFDSNHKVDLHTHTTFSDGLLTPEKLFEKAKSYKLKAISICDHDTIKAYEDRKTFSCAKRTGIELIPGIEFSTIDKKGAKYHILGFLIDIKNKNLKEFIKRIQKERNSYVEKVCELLNSDGWHIDAKKIIRTNISITKAHISRNLLADKRNQVKIKEHFNKIPSEGEFTETLLIKGKKYFVNDKNKIKPEEAIDIIHASKGVAILAHPGFNIMGGEKIKNLCDNFKSMGIDGFEAINIQYDKRNKDKRVDYVKEFTKYCIENNLLFTGGSDFHHSNKKLIGKFIDLGFKNDKYSVSYDIVEKLKKYRNQKLK